MPGRGILKVAVAQTESVLGELDANVRNHLAFVEEARAAGVELLLFPELSLTGYIASADALRLAISRHDPRIMEIARASRDMCAVFGFIEEGPAAQFHNSAIAVRDGAVVFIHHKINLPTYGGLEEGKHFAHGRYVDTFALRERWRPSVLVCADLWNPALVHIAAVHGATLLLAPISSAREALGAEFDNPGGWAVSLRFYAMMYGFPVLMANRVGAEGELSFWGGSCVLDPFGRVLAEATGRDEQLVTAELDYAELRRARYLLPTVRDSNLDLIHREIQRLAYIVGVPESVRRD